MKCRANKKQQEDEFIFDIFKQTIATIFVVLERQGFTTDQLLKLKDDVEAEFILMKSNPLGMEYNGFDAIEYFKKKGIDFTKSIKGK